MMLMMLTILIERLKGRDKMRQLLSKINRQREEFGECMRQRKCVRPPKRVSAGMLDVLLCVYSCGLGVFSANQSVMIREVGNITLPLATTELIHCGTTTV